MRDVIKQRILESIEVKKWLVENEELLKKVDSFASEIVSALSNGHKLILCGNGGSASDALHFASEIVGRFVKNRKAWPAIVLNADVATMTAISNDFSYDDVFARQIEAHCQEGDIFIGISTSGNSENVYRAVNAAKEKGIKTAALLGKDGGKIGRIVDYPLIVWCNTVARVQESHILLIHILCEVVEEELCDE